MSFQERFQGKMSSVGKKGLKHTLFQPQHEPSHSPLHPTTYRNAPTPISSIQNQLQAPVSSLPLRRQSTYQLITKNEQKQLLSTKSTTRRSQSINSQPFGSSQEDNFLDQMLVKHKNLIELIDRRASYKAN